MATLRHQMSGEIEKNVTDPVLRDWMLPDFTTTEINDMIVLSIAMMAIMKEYFSYNSWSIVGFLR